MPHDSYLPEVGLHLLEPSPQIVWGRRGLLKKELAHATELMGGAFSFDADKDARRFRSSSRSLSNHDAACFVSHDQLLIARLCTDYPWTQGGVQIVAVFWPLPFEV